MRYPVTETLGRSFGQGSQHWPPLLPRQSRWRWTHGRGSAGFRRRRGRCTAAGQNTTDARRCGSARSGKADSAAQPFDHGSRPPPTAGSHRNHRFRQRRQCRSDRRRPRRRGEPVRDLPGQHALPAARAMKRAAMALSLALAGCNATPPAPIVTENAPLPAENPVPVSNIGAPNPTAPVPEPIVRAPTLGSPEPDGRGAPQRFIVCPGKPRCPTDGGAQPRR